MVGIRRHRHAHPRRDEQPPRCTPDQADGARAQVRFNPHGQAHFATTGGAAQAVAGADADRLGVGAGDGVRVAAGGVAVSLAARLDPAMAPGSVGLVRGTTGELFVAPGRPVAVTADPSYQPPGNGVIARG